MCDMGRAVAKTVRYELMMYDKGMEIPACEVNAVGSQTLIQAL